MALNFGLDDTGFTALTYDEILDSIEGDLQTKFGNDIVLTPFGGIGSEPYVAVEMGRRAVAIELKDSYFRQMVLNVEAATKKTQGLFAEVT